MIKSAEKAFEFLLKHRPTLAERAGHNLWEWYKFYFHWQAGNIMCLSDNQGIVAVALVRLVHDENDANGDYTSTTDGRLMYIDELAVERVGLRVATAMLSAAYPSVERVGYHRRDRDVWRDRDRLVNRILNLKRLAA